MENIEKSILVKTMHNQIITNNETMAEWAKIKEELFMLEISFLQFENKVLREHIETIQTS